MMFSQSFRAVRGNSGSSLGMESSVVTGSEEASHYFCDKEMENAPALYRRISTPSFPLALSFPTRSSSFTNREHGGPMRPPLAVTILTNIGDAEALGEPKDDYDDGDEFLTGNENDEKKLTESRSSTCTTHSSTSSIEQYFCQEDERDISNRSHCGSLGYSVDSQECDFGDGDVDEFEEFPWQPVSNGTGEGAILRYAGINGDGSGDDRCYEHDDEVLANARPCFQLPFARIFAGLFPVLRTRPSTTKDELHSFQRPQEL